MSPSVKQLVDLYRSRDHSDLLVSAHRGYRWSGVPENARQSVVRAARAGLTSIEVDLRVTSDGVVVCIHDTCLGRVTSIAEHVGRDDVYNPLTGKGYNPLVVETPWQGYLEHTLLKDEMGRICDEGVMTLTDLVNTIIDNGLRILVFMDIKTRAGVEACYHQLKGRKDANGLSALEWCIFKPEAVWHARPEILEAESWYQDALRRGLQPLWIPVFDNSAWIPQNENVVDMLKAWASRPYTVSIEIGLRGPGGWLQDAVDWMTGPDRPSIGMGFFAALGDVRETSEGLVIPFASGPIPGKRLAYDDGVPPKVYEGFLLPGQTVDNIDCRADIDKYRQMGFTWAIADPAPEIDNTWRRQRAIAQGFVQGHIARRLSGRSMMRAEAVAQNAPRVAA